MIDPGVEMLLPLPVRSLGVLTPPPSPPVIGIGGVVGDPPRLEDELLLLAASTFEAAHMSNMVELEVAVFSFAAALELSLGIAEDEFEADLRLSPFVGGLLLFNCWGNL